MSDTRCDSCGKFSAGPFIVEPTYGDSSEYSRETSQIGPCCQSPSDLARPIPSTERTGDTE